MLKQLELSESTLKTEIKELKEDIVKKTSELQKTLKSKEKELKDVRNKIKNAKRSRMKDQNIHPMERFITWIKSPGKKSLDWIIDDGPLRQKLFSDMHRYETVDVVDRFSNFFIEIGWHFKQLDNDISIDWEDADSAIKTFDGMPDNIKKEITALIEDAIEQNVSEFKYDW